MNWTFWAQTSVALQSKWFCKKTGFAQPPQKNNCKIVLEPVWLKPFWLFRRYILQSWCGGCGRRSLLFLHSSSPTGSIATTRVAEVQQQLPGCLLSSNSPACCTATPRRCCTCTETPQLAVQHLPDLLHSNCTTFGTVYLPDFQCKTDDNISMHLPWRRSEPLVV